MKVFGRDYTKQELLSYVGNINQIAGVTRKEQIDGNGDGIRFLEVKNGSGMEFSVMENRCMDVNSMSYKGISLNFLSKNGLVYPLRYLPESSEDTLRHLCGGLFYTCGTQNVGYDCVDAGERQVCHGRIKAMSAVNVAAAAHWTEDDYLIELYGEVRETSLFGENIALRRHMHVSMGKPAVKITDELENEGFEERPLMYMYHLNLGFPFADSEMKIYVEPSEKSCRDEWAAPYLSEYRMVEKPQVPGKEICIMHSFREKKQVTTLAFNERLGFGFYIKQDTNVMPFLHEWKTNIAGAYAVGLEPANCHCEGRVNERRYGTLQTIAPFETVRVETELGILEDREQIEQLIKTSE